MKLHDLPLPGAAAARGELREHLGGHEASGSDQGDRGGVRADREPAVRDGGGDGGVGGGGGPTASGGDREAHVEADRGEECEAKDGDRQVVARRNHHPVWEFDSKLIDLSVKKQLEEIAAQLDLGDIQLVG
ncbi:hypothetical protein SASPL_108156 [Salvia splendens]|uniref:Uncharacterized protein n=1 Tax=Salvia splendens TaxID=180675 RepID=A0A8X8YBR8_SALSN|nr:hypothetical protein SASPL_108156 [Salvia splendens]